MKQLPEKMKAVVCYGPGEYKLEELPRPKAESGEVIIKVTACGICAGDVKAAHGADMFWGGDDPWVKVPFIPGHEFFGVVVELGEGAANLHNVALGDRVIAEQINPCGSCRFCRNGQYWMCEVHNIYGFQSKVADGGMAEYMRLHKTARIHKIPENVSYKDAAFIEPMACSIHAVQRAKIELDDVVVLAGAGPLGMGMIQTVALKNPKKFIVLDMDDSRLELARKYGADLVINPSKENAEKIVKDLTGGYGCDVYIEATGHPAGVKQGLQMIRKLGRFVEFSVFGSESTVDWSIIGDRKELDILGAHLGPYSYEIAIDLYSRGKITADDFVTHSYPLDEFEKGFETASSTESIKTLLVMDRD